MSRLTCTNCGLDTNENEHHVRVSYADPAIPGGCIRVRLDIFRTPEGYMSESAVIGTAPQRPAQNRAFSVRQKHVFLLYFQQFQTNFSGQICFRLPVFAQLPNQPVHKRPIWLHQIVGQTKGIQAVMMVNSQSRQQTRAHQSPGRSRAQNGITEIQPGIRRRTEPVAVKTRKTSAESHFPKMRRSSPPRSGWLRSGWLR